MPLFVREARVRRSGIQRISRRSGIQRISTDNLSGINFDGKQCQMSTAGSFQKSRNSSVELFLYARYLCMQDTFARATHSA